MLFLKGTAYEVVGKVLAENSYLDRGKREIHSDRHG
jgi:hypothetical protein